MGQSLDALHSVCCCWGTLGVHSEHRTAGYGACVNLPLGLRDLSSAAILPDVDGKLHSTAIGDTLSLMMSPAGCSLAGVCSIAMANYSFLRSASVLIL